MSHMLLMTNEEMEGAMKHQRIVCDSHVRSAENPKAYEAAVEVPSTKTPVTLAEMLQKVTLTPEQVIENLKHEARPMVFMTTQEIEAAKNHERGVRDRLCAEFDERDAKKKASRNRPLRMRRKVKVAHRYGKKLAAKRKVRMSLNTATDNTQIPGIVDVEMGGLEA